MKEQKKRNTSCKYIWQTRLSYTHRTCNECVFLAHLKIFESTPSTQPIKLLRPSKIKTSDCISEHCKKKRPTHRNHFGCASLEIRILRNRSIFNGYESPIRADSHHTSIDLFSLVKNYEFRIIYRLWQIDYVKSYFVWTKLKLKLNLNGF